ncbi:MAG: DUF2877 domain-containing protein [Tissierellia bacterium]|nr:DUF2877 domain-containing protein [Tissierellia bacterium]
MIDFKKGLYLKTKSNYLYLSNLESLNALSISISLKDINTIRNKRFKLILNENTKIIDLKLKGKMINKNKIITKIEKLKPKTGFGLIDREFYDSYEYISDYISSKSLEDLIGLGKGLTPSGDDFLAGFLAVNFLLNKKLDFNFDYTRTNSISARFLKYARKEIFSESLIKALTKSPEYFEQILNYGHTSGADTILGIYYALKNI